MTRNVMISAAILAAAAGSAAADMTYNMTTVLIGGINHRARDQPAGSGGDVDTGFFTVVEGAAQLATLTNRTEFVNNSAINPDDFIYISDSYMNSTISAQQSAQRFEVSWDYTSFAAWPGFTAVEVFARSQCITNLVGAITFTEDALVRFSFDVNGNDNGTERLTAGLSANWPYGGIVHNGNNDMDIAPFSFDLPVSAGDVFDFDLLVSSTQSDSGQEPNGWDVFSNGHLIVEILPVPTPSSAALLGLGGLVATRRRRAR